MKSGQHIQDRCMSGLLGASLIVGILSTACAPAPTPRPTVRPATPGPTVRPATPVPGFQSPGPSPEGLAWDGSHLWVVDGETKLLYQIDPATGEPVAQFEIKVEEPRGLAWDGENLWLIDEDEGVILALDPETADEVGRIDAPERDVEGPWCIADLTWDGEFLWVAISASWCSSLDRIDPGSGRTVVSFFPQCDPRGIGSDGTRLWTIAYNGEELPSRLDQRTLSDEIIEMVQSQEFLFELEVTDPTGLAYGDGILWVIDRAQRRIIQVKAP